MLRRGRNHREEAKVLLHPINAPRWFLAFFSHAITICSPYLRRGLISTYKGKTLESLPEPRSKAVVPRREALYPSPVDPDSEDWGEITYQLLS